MKVKIVNRSKHKLPVYSTLLSAGIDLLANLDHPVTLKPLLPIYWSDNCVTLFPGEEGTFTAKYFLRDAPNGKPVVNVNGWNVDMVTLK